MENSVEEERYARTIFLSICFYLPVICNRNIMIKTVIKSSLKYIQDIYLKFGDFSFIVQEVYLTLAKKSPSNSLVSPTGGFSFFFLRPR